MNKFAYAALASLILVPSTVLAQRESSAPAVSEIVVTKSTDSTSPRLFRNEPNAKLAFVRADGSKLAPVNVYISPTLLRQMRAGASGTGKTLTAGLLGKDHFNEAKLTCRKAGGSAQWMELVRIAKAKGPATSLTLTLQGDRRKAEPYLQVTLKDCMISNWSTSSGGDRPTETLSLNFTKIEYKSTPMNDSGK